MNIDFQPRNSKQNSCAMLKNFKIKESIDYCYQKQYTKKRMREEEEEELCNYRGKRRRRDASVMLERLMKTISLFFLFLSNRLTYTTRKRERDQE